MGKPNRYVEAFKESANAIGLSGAFAVSAVTGSIVPLLAALAAETAYLLVIPDSKWYTNRLAKRKKIEDETKRLQRRETILPTLRVDLRDRFMRLERIREQVETQTQQNPDWFREVLRKMDDLLEKFLLIATKDSQFRTYLESLQSEKEAGLEVPWKKTSENMRKRESIEGREIPRRKLYVSESESRWVQKSVEEVQNRYNNERLEIEEAIEEETDEDTKSVLLKRLEVLQRRYDYVGKIGKILMNIAHQLQLLEDTFGLVNDEIRARSPEQLLADIEEVVLTTNVMASALEEIAPYEQLVVGR